MPLHHHHDHNHNQNHSQCSPPPPSSCSSCCCCCYSSCAPPPSLPPDQVFLQTLLANQNHFPNPSPSDQFLLQNLASQLLFQSQTLKSQQQQRHHKDPENQIQSLLLSLLRRVSVLESQLPNLSPSPRSPSRHRSPLPESTARSVPRAPTSKPSVRDVAARTIQARFRLFLVRRSQTLRQLKLLASVKSHAAALRASLSGKTRVTDPESVSQKVVDLLFQLDSVQSSDPIIREGKRSLTKELNRILEFIDKVSATERRIPADADGGGGERRRRTPASTATKRVSFASIRDETKDSVDYAREPFVNDLIDFGIEVEILSRRVEGIEVNSRALMEDEDGPEAADGFRKEMGGKFQVQNGNYGLSAPMPVQMESRKS